MITDKIEKNKFLLIAGPCAIEGKDIAFEIAHKLVDISSKLSIPLVFKGSYRKANRTRLDSFTGIGDLEALKILGDISSKLNIPVITDIHSSSEAEIASDALEILIFFSRIFPWIPVTEPVSSTTTTWTSSNLEFLSLAYADVPGAGARFFQ